MMFVVGGSAGGAFNIVFVNSAIVGVEFWM